ncbi:LpxI family protein [Hyphomicrobium sp.]|jgi:DUF1009 family protein|uniref:LpxI family protein n=1 Tax=Hyphomicrobium sp. TaxID=82 RepID=UPI002B6FC8A6|nr:UDP-2,3-diacylglucosamine diphosphatase LpxI [Hyphomicrobium sp.]HVZ04228.1 UDP-2,3-diacylglucosamine diphosphatase LpxI [Hyphomicrobium sp.]
MTGPAKRIGIIAGSGSLPREVAESVIARGGRVHIVMVDGAADASLAMFPHTVVNWAQPGRATAALRGADVRNVIMLGGFQRPAFRTARPDLAFFKVVPSVLRLLKAGGDDAVLRGLVTLFEARGLTVVGVADAAPDLLIGEGVLTRRGMSEEDRADAERGFALVSALGRYDIGQAAVVTNGKIEAIEGAEGTDRMLKRVAAARSDSGQGRGGVLVKRPKPGQDLRVDLPAIGPPTIENVSAASLSGVAVMAGHVLAAERARAIALADERNVFVAGLAGVLSGSHGRAHEGLSNVAGLSSSRVGTRMANDIRCAAGILGSLSDFDTGSAVVIDGGRVIAVGTTETALDVVGRANELRRGKHRRGILAVASSSVVDEVLLRAVGQCNLQGIAVVGKTPDAQLPERLLSIADKLGVFVAASAVPWTGGDGDRA